MGAGQLVQKAPSTSRLTAVPILMPYSQRQKQYLEAMGLVPWSLRADSVEAEQAVPVNENFCADSLVESAPSETIIESVDVQNAGNCSVLLVFNETISQSSQALTNAENRLLLDMLGAIELQNGSVARRHALVDTSIDISTTIEPFLSDSVKAVLVAVQEEEVGGSDEESASRLLAADLNVPVWRLPHPRWIQQNPVLKRRAWNVLKAVRGNLPVSVVA